MFVVFLELGSTLCGIIMCCCGFMGWSSVHLSFDLLESSLGGQKHVN